MKNLCIVYVILITATSCFSLSKKKSQIIGVWKVHEISEMRGHNKYMFPISFDEKGDAWILDEISVGGKFWGKWNIKNDSLLVSNGSSFSGFYIKKITNKYLRIVGSGIRNSEKIEILYIKN